MGNLMNAAHALGIASCWIHRAKEEFESEAGKAILKELGIEGDYEGIGHCILGYAAQENKTAASARARLFFAFFCLPVFPRFDIIMGVFPIPVMNGEIPYA